MGQSDPPKLKYAGVHIWIVLQYAGVHIWNDGRCQLWSGRAPATAHTLQLHKLHKLCTIHTTEQNAKWWCCGPRCKPKLGRKQKATQSFDFKTIAFLKSDIILFFSHANHSPPAQFNYTPIFMKYNCYTIFAICMTWRNKQMEQAADNLNVDEGVANT